VIPGILGTKNDIEQWVGSDGQQKIGEEARLMKTDHIVMSGHSEDGELFARIKLFKKSPTPEYIVAVGRMKPTVHAFYKSLGHVRRNQLCRFSVLPSNWSKVSISNKLEGGDWASRLFGFLAQLWLGARLRLLPLTIPSHLAL
jgi:hypothetical protein